MPLVSAVTDKSGSTNLDTAQATQKLPYSQHCTIDCAKSKLTLPCLFPYAGSSTRSPMVEGCVRGSAPSEELQRPQLNEPREHILQAD